MPTSMPKGPSKAQIKTEADIEAERVKFENERRLFIERVASYETIASGADGARSSFEYKDWAPMDSAGLFIPAKFDPTFDPTKYEGKRHADLSWFSAHNLGLNYTQPELPKKRRHNNDGLGGYLGGVARNFGNPFDW